VIVLDANVIIAFAEHGHVHAAQALDILDTEEELLIHPLTLAECVVGAARQGQEPALRDLMERVGVMVWSPDPEHPWRLGRLRASTSLRLPDCCVLDVADHEDATLATFDTRLAQVARDRDRPALTLVDGPTTG